MEGINDTFKSLLSKKFDIVDEVSFLDFDYCFEWLINRLKTTKKDVYKHNEKIMVIHQDTDYYFDECSVGVNLKNFFQIIQNLDMSPSVLLFVTCNYNLKKEIDILCKDYHINDRPIVITSTIAFYSPKYVKEINNTNHEEYNFENIQYNALCMINETRSYRSALYHSLADIDKSKIAIQITNKRNNNVS